MNSEFKVYSKNNQVIIEKDNSIIHIFRSDEEVKDLVVKLNLEAISAFNLKDNYEDRVIM